MTTPMSCHQGIAIASIQSVKSLNVEQCQAAEDPRITAADRVTAKSPKGMILDKHRDPDKKPL